MHEFCAINHREWKNAMEKIRIIIKIIIVLLSIINILSASTPDSCGSGIEHSGVFLFNCRYIENGIYNNTYNDANYKESRIPFYSDSLLPVALDGYIQVRYYSNNDMDNSFDIRRARLSLKGNIIKKLNYKLQTEFGGSRQKLLDAELNFDIHPLLQLTAGQFTIPFSYENLISSSNLATINRSQIVEALAARGMDFSGNHNGRDIGMMIKGRFSLYLDYEYALGLFNGSGINIKDTNKQKDVIGRYIIHLPYYLSVGSSFYMGRYTPDDSLHIRVKRERLGIELIYDHSLFTFSSEYIQGKDSNIDKDGWYLQAGYYLFAQKIQLVTKYDAYHPDLNHSGILSTIYTLGINLLFNKKSKLQINYEVKDYQELEKEDYSFIVQLQFGF